MGVIPSQYTHTRLKGPNERAINAPEVLDEAGRQVADAGQALARVVESDDLVVCLIARTQVDEKG